MKKLQLVLTNPCLRNWDDMPQVGAGRHCDSCDKHIVDLTAKSDAELIHFFKSKKDHICGRLNASQLNRELLLPPSKLGWQWLLPVAIGAIGLSPAQAKELRLVGVHDAKTPSLPSVPIHSAIKLPQTAAVLHGSVVDELTGKPLKGVKIKQKGFENVLAITDSTGRFELNITTGKGSTPFTFHLDGYSKVEATLSNGIVVKLTAARTIMLGGISTINLNQEPLYLVQSGKKSCILSASRFKEISPEWIEKVEILKDASATAIYGSKAANGVIILEIKKAHANKIDFSKKK